MKLDYRFGSFARLFVALFVAAFAVFLGVAIKTSANERKARDASAVMVPAESPPAAATVAEVARSGSFITAARGNYYGGELAQAANFNTAGGDNGAHTRPTLAGQRLTKRLRHKHSGLSALREPLRP